jgi:hypothetical protein
MVENNQPSSSDQETGKRIFMAHARLLTEEQRQSLTEEEKAFESSCKDQGV